MGVLGLWQLLAPVGQPVTLESLENKIFAVDISIWLNQAVKGYRDSTGGSVPNAHLLSLFSRLCKLLFYKIRPIIVFDGGFPELKKQTIINRQQRRAAVKQNSREVGLKILSNYLASQQLVQANETASPTKVTFKHKEKPRDEVFKLPPLPESSQGILTDTQESNEDVERKFTNFTKEDIKYLNRIDIESEDFENLPPDVKQEILSTLKESRRHRTWDQFEELPKESNDFSNYQMQCLLKKRKLQSKLEQVQKDLRKINSAAYVSQYTSDHVIGETNKIMSDDTSYYVLLKKIADKKTNDSDKTCLDKKPGVSVMADTKNAFIRDIENIDADNDYFEDEDEALNKAIINSLSDVVKEENHSLNLSDEEYDVDNPPLLNIKESHAQNNNQDIECDTNMNEKNFPKPTSLLSSQSVKNNKQPLQTEVEEQDKNLHKKFTSNNSISDIEIINFEESIKKENAHVKSIELSSDDEMIPCEELKEDPSCIIHNTPVKNKSDSEQNENFQGKLSIPDQLTEISLNDCSSLNMPSTSNNLPLTSSINADVSSASNLKAEQPPIVTLNTNLPSTEFMNNDLSSLMPDNDELPSILTLNNSSSLSSVTSNSGFASVEHFNDSLPSTSSAQNNLSKMQDKDLQEANFEIQRDLETTAAILEADQAKQDRQAATVQDHMIEECKELLQLFGIPYIVSPLEAEAQCAFYDKVDLTHGTITDDSDVWLFGGKRVYKNFFTQQKLVECYKDREIFTHFGLSRKKLINFALLTGSDYTEGIEGVGPVTAMEIISEFPGEGIDALQRFKKWWDDANKHTRTPENKVRAKLRKLVLYNNFPDEKVFDAYWDPEVDSSTEKFTWGRPDLDALREYARERFGWNQSKVDDALLPVLKKLSERTSQTHIDSFFTVTLKKEKNLFPSKRIMSALKKITSPEKLEVASKVENKSTKRKSKTVKKAAKKVINKAPSGKGRKNTVKSQGPALSESSSESDC